MLLQSTIDNTVLPVGTVHTYPDFSIETVLPKTYSSLHENLKNCTSGPALYHSNLLHLAVGKYMIQQNPNFQKCKNYYYYLESMLFNPSFSQPPFHVYIVRHTNKDIKYCTRILCLE